MCRYGNVNLYLHLEIGVGRGYLRPRGLEIEVEGGEQVWSFSVGLSALPLGSLTEPQRQMRFSHEKALRTITLLHTLAYFLGFGWSPCTSSGYAFE